MTKVKDGVLALASKFAPESAVAKQAYTDEELSRIRASIADRDGGDFQAFLIRGARARQSRHPASYPDDFSQQIDSVEQKVLTGKAAGLSNEKRAILNDVARRHRIPGEWLSRVLAGRVLEDARRLYGLDDDAAMTYFNGGKA